MLVDAANGEEIAWQVVPYSNGVMDRQLPGGTPLGPDVALQDAADYLSVLTEGIPEVLRSSNAEGADVGGIGVDFTSCTVMPCKQDGTPLPVLPEFSCNPHAWVKLGSIMPPSRRPSVSTKSPASAARRFGWSFTEAAILRNGFSRKCSRRLRRHPKFMRRPTGLSKPETGLSGS